MCAHQSFRTRFGDCVLGDGYSKLVFRKQHGEILFITKLVYGDLRLRLQTSLRVIFRRQYREKYISQTIACTFIFVICLSFSL